MRRVNKSRKNDEEVHRKLTRKYVLLINHFYRFGEFTLDVDQKVLLRQGKPLLLAPKVLETLLTLVQHSGRIVEGRVDEEDLPAIRLSRSRT